MGLLSAPCSNTWRRRASVRWRTTNSCFGISTGAPRDRGGVSAPRWGAPLLLDESVLAPVRRVSAPLLRMAPEPDPVLAPTGHRRPGRDAVRHRLSPVHVSDPAAGAEGCGILPRLRCRRPSGAGATEPPGLVEGRPHPR